MAINGWENKTISQIFDKVSNPVNVQPNSIYQEIGIRSHGRGIFHKEPVTGQSLGNKRVFHIEPDCFVVNIVFAWEQAVARTTASEIGMIASHRFPMYKPKDNQCDVDYITYFFKTKKGKSLLELASPGGAGRNKTLGQNEFSNLSILLPPIQEQKKIAEILSTWDKAIETVEKLVANSQQQKKALMQQLLTGQKRLLDENGVKFGDEWNFLKFDNVFKVANNKSTQIKNSDYLESGSIPIIDQGQSLIAGYCESLNTYTDIPVIIFGDHTRCVKWVDFDFCMGADGTQVLKVQSSIYPKFGFYILSFVDIPNLGYSRHMRELKEKEFKIPSSIHEQKKIAQVLTLADREIDLYQQQLDKLKLEKKSLMQQLLTGQKRVKLDI